MNCKKARSKYLFQGGKNWTNYMCNQGMHSSSLGNGSNSLVMEEKMEGSVAPHHILSMDDQEVKS